MLELVCNYMGFKIYKTEDDRFEAYLNGISAGMRSLHFDSVLAMIENYRER